MIPYKDKCKGLMCKGLMCKGLMCKGFMCKGFMCKGFMCKGLMCKGLWSFHYFLGCQGCCSEINNFVLLHGCPLQIQKCEKL